MTDVRTPATDPDKPVPRYGPTRCIPADPELRGLVPNTATVNLPAPDAIKGGFGMLLIGIIGFLTRRDVTWDMRWYDR